MHYEFHDIILMTSTLDTKHCKCHTHNSNPIIIFIPALLLDTETVLNYVGIFAADLSSAPKVGGVSSSGRPLQKCIRTSYVL